MDSKQEVSERPYDQCAYGDARLGQLIDIIETVYRGASKGRGLVVSPKGASMLVRLLFTLPSNGQALMDHVYFRLLDSVPILESTLSCV